MTSAEFDTEFDVLYNNITSNQAPGLNRYEKSVFLTKAQSQLLSEYFSHNVDSIERGFDSGQRRQHDFSSLMVSAVIYPDQSTPEFDSRATVYTFPEDYLYIVNEQLEYEIAGEGGEVIDRIYYTITPLSYAEYSRLMSKPYKFPPKQHAWRLMTNANNIVEVVCREPANFNQCNYKIRYIKKPAPIVLEDLTAMGLSIDGMDIESQCELPESIHHEILERAVTLAKIAWAGATMTQTAVAAQSKQ